MKAALQLDISLREANRFVSLAKIGTVVGGGKFCCLEGQLQQAVNVFVCAITVRLIFQTTSSVYIHRI